MKNAASKRPLIAEIKDSPNNNVIVDTCIVFIRNHLLPILFYCLIFSSTELIKAQSNNIHQLTTFGLAESFNTQDSPQKLIKGDFNRDLCDDIAVLSSKQVKIFFQVSDSMIWKQSTINFSDNFKTGAYAKSKKDKFPLIALITDAPGIIQIYQADRFKNKKILWQSDIPWEYENILFDDLDGDQKSDIIMFGKKLSGILYFRGNGNGTFQSEINLFNEYSFNSLSIARLHSNIYQDIIASNWLTNQILVFAGLGKLNFSPPFIIDYSDDLVSTEILSMTKDDNPDMIACFRNSVILYEGDGGGGFIDGKLIIKQSGILRLSECNNDTYPDIVIGSKLSKSIFVLLNEDGKKFSDIIPFYGVQSISDLITFSSIKSKSKSIAILDAENRKIKFLYNSDMNHSGNKIQQLSTGVEPSSFVITDINKDGWDDIFVSNKESKTYSLFLNEVGNSIKGQISFEIQGKPSFFKMNRDNNSNLVAVTSDYSVKKLFCSSLNYKNFSMKTLSIPNQNRCQIIEIYTDEMSNKMKLYTLEFEEGDKYAKLHSYTKIAGNRFVDQTLSIKPSENLLTAAFLNSTSDQNKTLIYLSKDNQENKIELYKTTLDIDDNSVNSKYISTIELGRSNNINLQIASGKDNFKKDLIIQLGEPENKLYIFHATDDSQNVSFSFNQKYDIIQSVPDKYILQDLNEDGNNDLIFYDRKNETIYARYFKGKTISTGYITLGEAESLSDMNVADIDNDGKPELIYLELNNGLLKILKIESL
ncbi:MAG: VCBS repeat-containing protein [Ignavibacteriales bacterium]|nr:VCBS repeat-containing protein [Ignavibacteriales bacterium]